MSILHTKHLVCRQCHKLRPGKEFTDGICGRCLQTRAQSFMPGRYELPRFTNGEAFFCWECSKPIEGQGYFVWVNDAKRFAFFCMKCSKKKFAVDSLYRGTDFAYRQKVQ
jgi:hypothetical protein